ncbi:MULTISPECIES: SDR family NAD(P)-dependent oxidoreductase [unclassified Pseudomonas]|uniref:SDR family NAD(P)-dependent oxidoreductase n=1 Tax=unclassified Pseudomonas TaxID=196821 RepID=UPI002AC9EE2A|nr:MULTISPECIES: SDR family NAD(P)-dependent oxidoreductase [unclassified Pseudomonas]MEB0042312.1 SDR family NAD(P)-dependent oxidoreductase [Pseudomonas sp. MH10]MEB0078842.1 SDR family NAD(P)-dependent oxidoreductase [Pseudomonas sp. MH10out]MEB0089747.1 SDR family NAD(P)-dependent oxidoreductase [Pseudomonas sp. CCI4.2]MEB0103000.1 SDR family NAD(P)-dependent oxidoreductase [Pseudomonas sp. CCI3.2]MEB0121523.1 SDR family NAD(P)-dependent oxidoreductase [Pseudomonas sp. CCI1.2]
MPSFRLDGKTALITGAGGGIGAGIAHTLSAAGAGVVLVGRTESRLIEVAELICLAGGQARTVVCDVTDSAAIRAMINALPSLDILVNNAGTNYPEPMLEMRDEHLDEMLNLNIRACYVVAQAAVAKMLERTGHESGSVINVSSQMGHVGAANRTAYCMTKHAVEGLTKAMAIEFASRNIRVNTICPTFVDTPMIRKIASAPGAIESFVSKIPLGRMAQMEDIVGAALYLAGPASRMVTGTSLKIDGGWTAQ